jgi:ATP-dependent RNA helicase DDX19/DBP5
VPEMSQKIDWAKFADEQEKVLRQKISQINIQSNEANGKDFEDAPEQFSVAEATLLRKVLRKGLMDSKNDIKVQRENPNSPLYLVKTFEALNL